MTRLKVEVFGASGGGKQGGADGFTRLTSLAKQGVGGFEWSGSDYKGGGSGGREG